MTLTLSFIAAQALAWAVLLCAIIASIVIIERWVFLGRARLPLPQLVGRLRTVLRKGEPGELAGFCGRKRSPQMSALRRFSQLWRDPGNRELMYQRALGDVRASMEKWLPALASIAGVTPMLGVLTLLVVYRGLLEGDPAAPVVLMWPFSPFAIAALSLGTGVIALIAHNLFVVRVRSHTRDLEQMGRELLRLLSTIVPDAGRGTDSRRQETGKHEEDEFFRKKP